jgi:enoyl-CoA hydratase/carnithine racemase
MNNLVRISKQNDVAVIAIDNPPVNALSPGVPEGIAAAIDEVNRDTEIRAAVVIGGGRTFVAGADIKEFGKMTAGGPRRSLLPLLLHIEDSEKPVVMAIHGTAFGGGLELAMAGHCTRCIGVAERALETMCKRVQTRVAFGKPLAEQGTIRADIAQSRMEIEQARFLTLNAAYMMDTAGNKEARAEIAMIKVVAPNIALRVLDRAIQTHGGCGVSRDTFLAGAWANVRTLRLADGPDEVHTESIAKLELQKWNTPRAQSSPRSKG